MPRFYAPVTSLLNTFSEKAQWECLKTMGQLKREKGLKMNPNEDSLYKVGFRSFFQRVLVEFLKLLYFEADCKRGESICSAESAGET